MRNPLGPALLLAILAVAGPAAAACPPGSLYVIETGTCLSLSSAARLFVQARQRSLDQSSQAEASAPRSSEFALQQERMAQSYSDSQQYATIEGNAQQNTQSIIRGSPGSAWQNRFEAGADRPSSYNPTLEPVRVFLRGKDIPPANVAAYGVVAFRGRPTSASRGRLLMACSSFQSYLEPELSLSGVVAPGAMMVTVWPLHHPEAVSPIQASCDTLIDDYDLYGADTAIADAQRQHAKFGDDGPFLIGWSPSSTRGQPDKLVLVMDMSHLNSQDSFDRVFLAWKQKVIENPSLWRNGFSLESARLAVRDFLDEYGQTIVAAFSDSGGAKAATVK